MTSDIKMTRQFVREQITPFWLTFRDNELERKYHQQTCDQLLEWKDVYDLVTFILLGIHFVTGIISGILPSVRETIVTLGFLCVYRLLFLRAPRWRLLVAVGWFVGCLLLALAFAVHSGRMLAGIVLFHHIRIVGGVTVFRRWIPYALFSCLCEVMLFLICFLRNGGFGYLDEPAYLAALCYGCVLAHVIESQQRANFLLVSMLDEQQRHWQRFTELSPDGVVVYGPNNNNILYHNEAATPLLESRELQSVEGFDDMNSGPLPPLRLFEHMTAKFSNSQPKEFACVARTNKNQYLRSSVVATPYKWRNTDSTLFIFRNTTARLELETLRRASSARALLWASLSHNLRTPLNGILAAVGPLQNELSSVESLEMIDLLRSSASLLSTFMSDILDYVSIELDQLELKIVPFDIGDLLNDCVRVARDTDIARHVDLRLELLYEFPRPFWGDCNRIKQVLMNLLCNALRYTRQGFVRVRAHVANNILNVEVQDSGIGVSKKLKPLIFDWLEQATSGEIFRTENTVCGFGLPISKALCGYMNGEIGVHSDSGVGSTFWFTIPEQKVREDSSPYGTLQSDCNHRLLIVDDNDFNRVVIKSMLKETDFLLREAENGAQALEQYRQEACDVILMDISMPIMDGLQATEQIRRLETDENKQRSVIIAVTAFVSENQEVECRARGMDACLGKPVAKRDLLRSIEQAMHRRDQEAHNRLDENAASENHPSTTPII